MSNLVRALLGAALLTVIAVSVGVVVHHSEDKAPVATEIKGDLSTHDTTTMAVQRSAFCSRVPAHDVTTALGGKATATDAYDDGDKAALTPGVTDVAQEYGCSWSGPQQAAARAWVFASPVTQDMARRLARTPLDKGCTKQHKPAYGKPSVAITCTSGKQTTVELRGLFGDAWMACELRGAPSEKRRAVQKRASRWCLVTATAAG